MAKYGLPQPKSEWEEAIKAGHAPYASQVPREVVEAVFEMESSRGNNPANEKYDLGQYGWLTGLTKTGHAANAVKNATTNPSLAAKYQFTKVPGWQDISTPEAAFAHTASALAIAKRDNPNLSWEDIYFKKYNAAPQSDLPKRRLQFRKLLTSSPPSSVAMAETIQSQPVKAATPFAATKLGIATNTVRGLPTATGQVAKDIGRGIARNMLSAVATVGQKFGGANTVDPKNIKDFFGQSLFETVFGNEPVETVDQRVAESEIKIKNSPLAQKLGIDKAALPFSMFGVIGSTALDITPFGGEKNVAKQLLKEVNPENVANILAKMGVVKELIPKFADQFAKANTPELVEEGLTVLKQLTGVKRLADLEKATPTILDKTINPVDRLIAENKIRVVSRDGRDVYQVQKGGKWVNTRDESSAVEQLTREPKPRPAKPPIELPAELEQKAIDLQMRQEALNTDPAKELGKYALGRGDFAGRLPEVTGEGSSRFARKGDDIVTELGFKDSEEARLAYDDFKVKKTALDQELKTFRQESKQFINSEKDRLALDDFLNKQPIQTIAPRQATTPLLKSGQGSLASELGMSEDQLLLSRQGLSTGEARSLQQIAQQATEATSLGDDSLRTSFNSIIRSPQTPVKKKVGYLDYWRTPEPVLEKIGLGEPMKLIRAGREAIDRELPKNISKITDWSKQIAKDRNRAVFRYLDGQAVDLNPQELKVAGEIKGWLKEWASRLGLPEDKQISHYITHIFDDQLIQKEFDEDLAKIIADKVPGSVYDPFLQKRLGAKGYIEDTWRALDAYVKRATRKVHMDPALEKLEEAASSLEESQWDYIKNYADRLNLRPTKLDTLVDNSIKQTKIGYHWGQRPVANISRALRKTTFRGMIGGNVGSALRNLSQGVNTYAKLGEKYTALGYAKIFTNGMEELREVGVLSDNFVQDRALSATKKWVEKMDKGLFLFFDTAEKVNRGAAYYGAKAKAIARGKTEAEAIEFAKRIVRDTQFQYGSVDTPVTQFLSSDTGKIFSQFMSYPVKQTEFLAEMAKNREYAGVARYVLGGLAFTYTIGQALGMSPSELIPWYDYVSGQRKFGTPPSLKLPWEATKAALDAPDKYGNDRSLSRKIKDVGREAVGWIPAGNQIKKTIQGLGTVSQGKSTTASGATQYKVKKSTSNTVRAALFGKYGLPEAQQYYDNKGKSKPKKTTTSRYGL